MEPVVFLQQPQSLVILKGSSASLTCRARVEYLGRLIHIHSEYSLPVITWSINGAIPGIDGNYENRTEGTSTLLVSDSGYYQCIATDGIAYGTEEGHYVTVSNRARVDAVDNNDSKLYHHHSGNKDGLITKQYTSLQ